MLDDERDLFSLALRTWGPGPQVGMLHEEIGELLMALNKVQRAHPDRASEVFDNLAEEVADVLIMLDQMQVLFRMETRVETWRQTKVQRLRDRLRDAEAPDAD